MTYTVNVSVDGQSCPVTVSDENRALLDAKAAGGAIVGIWREDAAREPDTAGFDACLYLATDEEDVDEAFLERAARRHLGLPWTIAETARLRIREFADGDPLEEPNPWDCGVFCDKEARSAYIRHQYRFQEYGLWALEETSLGAVIGKAGITGIGESPDGTAQGELGYHLYPAYRGKGYAEEACRAILRYAREEMGLDEVFVRAEKNNTASAILARKLGILCISPRKDEEIS